MTQWGCSVDGILGFFHNILRGLLLTCIPRLSFAAMLPEGLVLAPRETEADHSGQTDTLDRRLKGSVFLVMDGQLPTVSLPDGPDGDESLLEAAKRAILENGGEDLEIYYPSGAPMAVHMSKDKDPDENSPYFGTKTFFLRVQYAEAGEMNKIPGKKFEWLDRSEIVEIMEKRGGDHGEFYRYML